SEQFTSTTLHRMTLAELQVLQHHLLQMLATATSGSAADRDTRTAHHAVRRMILHNQRSLTPRFYRGVSARKIHACARDTSCSNTGRTTMRRIDDFTDLANETLIRPDGLDDDFCHWVHCYFLERDMLPDEKDFHVLINALVRELLKNPQG